MAQKSGFFNAKLIDGDWDRKYQANDYADNLAVVIGNGVLRSENNDLNVTSSGMKLTVGVGRAWINGHYYFNDSPVEFFADSANTGGNRYDRIMLRLDKSIDSRNISLVYVKGTPANVPEAPAPIRNSTIYDLVLANIFVQLNSDNVIVSDVRQNAELCGWIYSTSGDNSFFKSIDNSFYEWFNVKKDTLSSVTLFKRYTWETTLNTAVNYIQFNIPQYNSDTCFIEVYVNGILDTQYTIDTELKKITFAGTLIGGTVVTVNCYKSIDGTGIMTVSDEITELQNKVEAIKGNSSFIYICNSIDDNISLSQIAQAIINGYYNSDEVTNNASAFLTKLGGNTYLYGLESDSQIQIDVVGNLGVSVPYSGDGSNLNPFKWFKLGDVTAIKKRIIFDFGKCNKFRVSCDGDKLNSIFYGSDLHVKNVNIQAYSIQEDEASVLMVDGVNNNGGITFDDCRFELNTKNGSAIIAKHGTFTNCYANIKSDNSTAYCFNPESTGLVCLNGGEYYAYGLTASSVNSSIIHISASDMDAAVLANNLYCPLIALENYSQGFLSEANAGHVYINGVVTSLTSSGNCNNIVGHINKT